ncbi:hypothetical protein H112_05922 [Trichophyton rubrum D6]|uniref:Uncharacterized protein n=2 Tax=Trichophyton TaxID=5550 RepID=A0A022VXM1_TRIRU|nr:hypothetical protein H100_05937 [Trichophyton rubrum MR850]EZF40047.1 hypothetical protein H102_05907 [Trichophyton rubrum CBS 100081]EZF50669.1 hypothetical protein H103_05933 [Trichophyton rubrum CBS 288.86]EZF61279.1 hypothetical protein H104_05919 [Trichophyton rubrum CBS 289.86]EZF71874.1 hypothetical protein H105_05948 [Trichophyton soudanense CBS 452.61]EZF82603.1 hypothetical protein H110_05927 [Trichophyton rubrum MR1448]EZG14800.1 hypothetical protein H107_06068 [Trichophyton rub
MPADEYGILVFPGKRDGAETLYQENLTRVVLLNKSKMWPTERIKLIYLWNQSPDKPCARNSDEMKFLKVLLVFRTRTNKYLIPKNPDSQLRKLFGSETATNARLAKGAAERAKTARRLAAATSQTQVVEPKAAMIHRLRHAVSLAERAVIRDMTALNHQAAVRPARSPVARNTAITRTRKSAAMTEEAVPSRAHAIRTEDVVPITNGPVERVNATTRCSRSAARTVTIPGPVVKGNHAVLPRRAVIAAKQRSVVRAEPVLTRAAAVRRNAAMKTKNVV